MTFNLDGDDKIAELIAAVPAEDRARALEAAEKSYVQTAVTLDTKMPMLVNGHQL